MAAMKAKEKEMKEEKEAARQVSSDLYWSDFVRITGVEHYHTDSPAQQRIQAIKDKRAKKEEKVRYEKMAEKMHRKRVDRLKRKEKRNKLLNS